MQLYTAHLDPLISLHAAENLLFTRFFLGLRAALNTYISFNQINGFHKAAPGVVQ
jgi:hypothetical protein